jgi:hypothetical protein
MDAAVTMIERSRSDFNASITNLMKQCDSGIEEFKRQLQNLNFESQERNLIKLDEMISEKRVTLKNIQEQKQFYNHVSTPIIPTKKIKNFWNRYNFSVTADYQLDILGLEYSKIDFFATSKNQKHAIFALIELNRDSPESNILKLMYYLKNSKEFWGFDDITILQFFSPKYIVEKKGKSLALAREMSDFLGNELFTGVHSFGEQKVNIRYRSALFGLNQYELFSVFWKLMQDPESGEEERFEKMIQNLPSNKNFLTLCTKHLERERAKNRQVPEYFQALAEGKGKPEHIIQILQQWCFDILLIIEEELIRLS